MEKRIKFSFLHRFLHWTIAVVILFMFITVFLRSGWLNSRDLAATIANGLAAKGITSGDVRNVSREISHSMFKWHAYIGYVLVGLYIIRLVYMFIKGIKFPSPFVKENSFKKKLQGLTYVGFYIFLTVIVATGLFLAFTDDDYPYHDVVQTVHEFCYYIMLIFVVVHFAGIYIGERTDDKGIVSKMISGLDNN
jgi:cytochrome b561